MGKAREAGSSHVGYQFWKKLAMDEILKRAGFSEKETLLALIMVMNLLNSTLLRAQSARKRVIF